MSGYVRSPQEGVALADADGQPGLEVIASSGVAGTGPAEVCYQKVLKSDPSVGATAAGTGTST